MKDKFLAIAIAISISLIALFAASVYAVDQNVLVGNWLVANQSNIDITTGYDFVWGKTGKTGLGGTMKLCSFLYYQDVYLIDLKFGGLAYKDDAGYAGSNFIAGPATSLARIESLFKPTIKSLLFKYLENNWNASFGISTFPEDINNLKGEWGIVVFANQQIF